MAARPPYLLIVLPLLMAACGGGSKHAVTGDPLGTAADRTSAQSSEHVGMQAKIDLSGQSLTLSGDGGFARKDGQLHVKFNLPGLGSSSLDEIFQGDVAWLDSPLLASTLKGKHWIKLDLSKPVQAFGFNLNVLTGQTPSAVLDALRLPGSVSSAGTQTIDGVKTTHYHKTPSSTGKGTGYTSVDAWIDDGGLVRQVKLEYDAKVDPTSSTPAHTVLTMQFSAFGAPVRSNPPPAGDVVDASVLGK
jgi:hypothetical protein